jgi:hypothetical protein
MASSPLVQITIRGGAVAIIDGSIYAALISPPNATTWIATAADGGTIQFTDQASGLILAAPNAAPGTQAVAAPPGAGMPVTSWLVTQFSDSSEDEPAPVKDPSQLTRGYYAIQEPSSGEFLFRNRIEDYSLMPKRVGLQETGLDQGPLIFQVSS